MFLTIVLLRNAIPGKQWIGKYRRPRFIGPEMKRNMIRRLEIEAENIYWLSRAYMTQEQSREQNREQRRAALQALIDAARAKFPEHKYIADHLDHLNVTKKWGSP
ncbi:ribosomal protein 63, mitochondrial [Hemicordylus capensis]|uniref:ribosomal protein 63, mitochondrial n=1 Tax=Hemicordylus capensis TaxID=884348 RepID=UPI002303CF84|nr:ribosomal protein 63, mitochondrial [Hemicordylus capensis]XP_053161541.1 ribosomal protein 63, mitochondrial [Hemicordylus capensis]XP_053161542.1 ribosomal protein 63, mitochondrial [Hemicordylus capensis]XP_053161543.1 ribosomal protein 63, mitochondrial [Hemicordylus capensis]